MVIMQFKWKLLLLMMKKQNNLLSIVQLHFRKNIGSQMERFMLIWL
jgi:hypothetical protein